MPKSYRSSENRHLAYEIPLRKRMKIVCYVPTQSSRCLYKDAEFNLRAEAEEDKTTSEYKQFDCLGATLSNIRKRKREFVYRGAEVKLRLILLRTCTCGIISHLYRNKVDAAERVERGSRE